MLDPYSLRQNSWRKKIYLAAVERSNLQGASRLIFTTVHEQQAAQESLPWLAPGKVVPLGADCPPYMSRDECAITFTSLFPQVLDRRCILFLGRIHQKKGLERVLSILPKIASKYPKTLLVVAGDGERAYVRRIKELVCEGNLEHHVLFTGMIRGQAKWGAFACAEVFVLPSHQENFAIAMAEAMHMAVPVIVSNKVNSWPFVETANAGFVIEEEHIEAGLEKRLDELLSAPEKARRLGKHGQDFAREHLNWQRVARDMSWLYRRTLSE
jgi:glycosyltransferase involved in cell wall biosynthesis